MRNEVNYCVDVPNLLFFDYFGLMEMSKMLNNLYGHAQRPYYIYTPRWIESSAGIKALHYLCHYLNRSGQIAYLVMCEPIFNKLPRVSPNLLTPILTQEIAESHFQAKLTPVTIYSETIPGNPINASFIVRYLMNFIGTLDGPKTFEEHDYIVSFSRAIAKDAETEVRLESDQVLFLPPIDPREFVNNPDKKDFQVVYAGKYRSFIGPPRKVGLLRSVEIFRDGPRMQNREMVKKLLSEASMVYTFENSSIATEAILSGTPVCFVRTELTKEIIAEYELGDFGVALEENSEAIEEARSTVPKGIETYYESIRTFQFELEKFIELTQIRASETGYNSVVQVPIFETFITSHRISIAWQVLRKRGPRALIRVVYHFAMRRLSWRFWQKDARNQSQ